MAETAWSPSDTREGRLSPWEVAKTGAYHEVITAMAAHLGSEPSELLGCRVDEFIADRVCLQGQETFVQRRAVP